MVNPSFFVRFIVIHALCGLQVHSPCRNQDPFFLRFCADCWSTEVCPRDFAVACLLLTVALRASAARIEGASCAA